MNAEGFTLIDRNYTLVVPIACYVDERGEVGESMAAVILDKVREQDPEAFAAAVSGVERDFVAEFDRNGNGTG